jgi:Ubiquinol-cytochrome C reductase complex 14kD subunit.
VFSTFTKRVGLRYEDIINENEKEVAEALSLADPDVITGRTRRLKRAIDLNFKRKNFMDYAPDVNQETFKMEIYEDVEKIKARDQEYALLNAHNK